MREQETARACGGNNAASAGGLSEDEASLKAGGGKSSGNCGQKYGLSGVAHG